MKIVTVALHHKPKKVVLVFYEHSEVNSVSPNWRLNINMNPLSCGLRLWHGASEIQFDAPSPNKRVGRKWKSILTQKGREKDLLDWAFQNQGCAPHFA